MFYLLVQFVDLWMPTIVIRVAHKEDLNGC